MREMCRGGGRGPEGVVSSDVPPTDAENSERVGDLPYERPRATASARAINCGRPRRPRPRVARTLVVVFSEQRRLPNRDTAYLLVA